MERDLPDLMKFNLVEKTESENGERYELNPVLYQFIRQDIESEDEKKSMFVIIQFYKKVLAKIYKKIAIRKNDSEVRE